MWILTNPHNLTMYIWDALSVNANRLKELLNKHKKMFESRFCGSKRKILGMEKRHAQIVAWYNDMEGHAQKMR